MVFELDEESTEYTQGLLESTEYQSPDGWFQVDRTGVDSQTADYEVGPVGGPHTQSVEVHQHEVDRLTDGEQTAKTLHEAYLEEKPGDSDGTSSLLEETPELEGTQTADTFRR